MKRLLPAIDLIAETAQPPTTGFASQTSPSTSTQAGSPPALKFSLMKNLTDKGPVSMSQVSSYLDAAHKKYDEEESVCFGLEQDDGSIVKVYVAKDQGDAFEAALSTLLGKEDDVERVIDMLATDFDIVTVEWPDEDQEGGEGSEEQSDKLNDLELTKPNEVTLDINPADVKKDKKPEEDKEGEKKPEDKDGEGLNDLELGDDEKKEGDKEDSLDDLELGDEGEEKKDDEGLSDLELGDEEDEEEPEEGEEKPKKKKAKKAEKKDKQPDLKKESLHMTIGNNFLQRYLGEAAPKKDDEKSLRDKEKDEKNQEDLEELFSNPLQRTIVDTILLLGLPAELIRFKRIMFRSNVREVARTLNMNTQARIWLKKLAKELPNIVDVNLVSQHHDLKKDLVGEGVEDTLAEASTVRDQLTNSLQELIFDVLVALGVPEIVLSRQKQRLRPAFRATALILSRKSKARTFLKMLAKSLGIDADLKNDPEEGQVAESTKLKHLHALIEAATEGDEDRLELLAERMADHLSSK